MDRVVGSSTVAKVTVSRLLDRSARLWTAKTAVVSGELSLTYDGLLALSCRFARLLQGMGVERGHRVALILPNSVQFIVCFFAIARIGAVLVPLNPAYTDDELSAILQDADVRDIFCVPTHRDRIEALRGRLPQVLSITPVASLGDLEELCSGHSADRFDVPIEDTATHAIMFTSGTTGRVKGAILSHRARVANTLAGQLGYEITSQTRASVPAPMFHSGGMILGLINVLSAGGTILIPRDGSVDAAVEVFAAQGANMLLAVPTVIFRMVEHPVFSRVARDLPFAIIHGAAPIPRAVVDRLLDGFPKCRPFHGYGSTEACQLTVLGPDEYRRFPDATGRALPGIDVRVVDQEGRDVAPGIVGEIVTAGPHVFDGYLNAPGQTAEALHDGLHWTGDLATMDERGILTVVGRRKDMIISGGFNIYAREVENVLQSHPAVQEAAVFGVPDMEWGESVGAALMLRPGMNLSADDIVRHCRDRLASYKKPRHIYFIAEFPRNTIGKVMKSKLAEILKAQA